MRQQNRELAYLPGGGGKYCNKQPRLNLWRGDVEQEIINKDSRCSSAFEE